MSASKSSNIKYSESHLVQWSKCVTEVFADRERLKDGQTQKCLVEILRGLESGNVRVASPKDLGANCGNQPMTDDLNAWIVHSWVKEAILLLMAWRTSQSVLLHSDRGNSELSAGAADKTGTSENPNSLSPLAKASDLQKEISNQGRIYQGTLSYFDKFDMRGDLHATGARVVPLGVVREGAYIAPGVIVMPGFVNIGAWVGNASMVDTWATVGSCAQIGQGVHLAGGVGIGGVLEPANARPVLIGDEAFIGSRVIVVEGAVVGARAVLGAGCIVTASTPIIDVTGSKSVEYRGFVPAGAVVAPGTRSKVFPSGTVDLQCCYVIGYRNTNTDAKISLNQILRETGLAV